MTILSLSRSLLHPRVGVSSVISRRTVATSPWAHFAMAPTDPIVGLNELFAADDFPQKVIVGVGAYRDNAGKPYVLPSVRKAEQIMMNKQLDMEYSGIVRCLHVWLAFWEDMEDHFLNQRLFDSSFSQYLL